MIGQHLIKAWSRTQNHITLSSAEAELYARVKCTAELIGIKSMMTDWGRSKSGILYADSTAALGIAKRKGAGKPRHININTLWIQECKATTASTRTPGWVELSGLRPRPSPGQRDLHWHSRTNHDNRQDLY